MVLLEEVGALKIQKLKQVSLTIVFLSWPRAYGSICELSATAPVSCLPACLLPCVHHDGHEL